MNRAVFLDRDGTINEEVGYVNHVSRFHLYPWSAQAICRLNQAGFKVIVISNQSGIARGRFPASLVEEIHAGMRRELEEHGAHLDGIYYCPHHPEGKVDAYRCSCECRKPKPGMLLRAAEEWDVDLGRSFLVGDKYLDIETAHAASVSSILVLSGYGRGEYLHERNLWPRPPDHIAENLLEAADWIVRRSGEIGPGN